MFAKYTQYMKEWSFLIVCLLFCSVLWRRLNDCILLQVSNAPFVRNHSSVKQFWKFMWETFMRTLAKCTIVKCATKNPKVWMVWGGTWVFIIETIPPTALWQSYHRHSLCTYLQATSNLIVIIVGSSSQEKTCLQFIYVISTKTME